MLINLIKHVYNKINYKKNTHLNRFKIFLSPPHRATTFDSVNDNWKGALVHLRKFGYAKLPSRLSKPTKRLQWKNAFNPDQDYIKVLEPLKPPNEFGITSGNIDINSKAIIEEILTNELFLFLCSYYGKYFWIRNNPIIRFDSKKYRTKEYSQRLLHLDFVEHQTSVMVLLNDIDEQSTCTEYIPQTHKKSWLFQNAVHERHHPNSSCRKCNRLEQRYGVKKILGQEGDMFIIDAGNGLHRGHYGNDRAMLHFNFAQYRRYADFNQSVDWDYKDKNLLLSRNPTPLNSKILKENGWDESLFKYVFNQSPVILAR